MKTKQQRIDTMKKELAILEQELKEETTGRWVPEIENRYFRVDEWAKVGSIAWRSDEYDKFHLSQGNVFRTEEEAEAHLEYLKAVAVIKEDAKWWKPDWGDIDQRKWYGWYNNYQNRAITVDADTVLQGSSIYFQSKKLLEKSLKEHKKEWEIYFNVG